MLAARFPAADVYTREERGKRFHYISAERTIDRFNEVFPLTYDWRIDQIEWREWPVKTSSGKHQWAAHCKGHITLDVYDEEGSLAQTERGGVGAAVNADLDMALKSAQAEAFKKAGHQFGVGLYLWHQDERDLVDAIHSGDYAKAASRLCRIDYDGDKLAMLTALEVAEPDPEALLQAAGLI